MNKDPYAICPCGAGVKQKWCNAKSAMEQAEKAVAMIQNNQQEASVALLAKLSADRSQPECFRAYAAATLAQAYGAFNREEEALRAVERAVEDFPTWGIVHEVQGDFPFAAHDYAAALERYYEALTHYPDTATRQACRTLFKIGACHNFQGRPLAAWAAWSSALKLDPEYEAAKEALQNFIQANGLLPNRARRGLELKPADEFTLFQEGVGERWEQAAEDGRRLHLDDLVAAFEDLAAQAPDNGAAWYNLALALAWSGENLAALDALRRYVELEPDFDAAADAWDLAEVLRLGAGAESESDCLLHVAVYRVLDPQGLVEKLKSSKRVAVAVSADEQASIHWMDKDVEPAGGAVPILGGPPRQIAQLRILGPFLEVAATGREDHDAAVRQLETVAGGVIQREETEVRAAEPHLLDVEPLQYYWGPNAPDAERGRRELEAVRAYFEEKWLHRPLRALGGLPPLDAAQASTGKKMLEGVLRFRERIFQRRGVPYNFDRLRNKLGLPISGAGLADETDGSKPSETVDLAVYSAPQLAALDPRGLSDDQLAAAYRASIHLDAPQTASNFALEIVERDSIAQTIDVAGVFRRLIQDRLQSRQTEGLDQLIQKARRYSDKHYGSRNAPEFDLLEARALLLGERRDEAVSRLRSLIERFPDRLDVAASAVESLLSAGDYASAKAVSEQGLAMAEAQRNPDLQSQFRDYAKAAAARV
jgi:tetratricopeptide (TPR) repeat protein